MMPSGSSRTLLALALILAVLGVGAADRPATAAGGVSLTAIGSPFDPDRDGARRQVTIVVETEGLAQVDLDVRDFDGRHVKTMARRADVDGRRAWTWTGRDKNGRKVAYGPYRVKATVYRGGETFKRATWVTRAKRAPYRVRPGAIVVAIDPGHGGPAPGAVWKGLREDDVNLDISLRLEAMLRGAGIGVVMTRRTDRNVSPVGKDLNFDGRYTRVDELIARNDVANQARADIHLAVHNNATACHCQRGTEMYTHNRRGWSPEGRKLARALLSEHIWHLRQRPGYSPRSRGLKSHGFKALKPYHPRAMPRPSLQPSVLGESLFLDWPSEARILKSRSGRTIVAAAYFDGIARYLAKRPYGLRYQVLAAPKAVRAGSKAGLTVRLTNRGGRTSSGWKLVARVVPKVARYDGRPRRGRIVAKVAVPDGLGPGQSVEVVMPTVPMPGGVGKWLLKLDVNLPRGQTLSRHGVVGPQLSIRTVRP